MDHKLGIIGFSGMATWHTEHIRSVDGLTVVAAYDISEDRVQAAEMLGIRGYRNLESFLQDDSFDMVLVATTNDFHKPMVLAALAAGKNVICEKPASMCAEDLEEMIAAAKKAKKIFTVHHNRRWDKDYQMVKQVVEAGQIGKIYALESRAHGQNGILFGWRNKKAQGGGVLRDWGVHMIDQILMLIPEHVVQVYAQMFRVLSDEVEDYFKLLIRFESGVSALVEVGTQCFAMGPRWVVHGEKGSILVEDWDCNGKVVVGKPYTTDWAPAVVQTVAGPTRTMAPRARDTLDELKLPDVGDKSDWRTFYRNVMNAIDEKEPLLVKPEQALRVKRVIDCAFMSDEQGNAIKTDI